MSIRNFFAIELAAVAVLVTPTFAEAQDAEVDQEPSPLKRPFDAKIQLGDSELTILDARDREAFSKSHLPGAVHVDVADWKKKSLASGGLEDLDWWAERMGKLGIGTDGQVVVYGDDPPEVARVWWLLRYFGVRHATILDGGFAAWKRLDYPLEWDEFAPEERTFIPSPMKDRFCSLARLKESVASGTGKTLDVRSPGEYVGDPDSEERSGHVPGATNLEWSELLRPDGTYKDAKSIRALLKEHGFAPEDAIIVHCRSGGRASAAAFALELAGYANVANYYPGWSEYGRDENSAIVLGPAGDPM